MSVKCGRSGCPNRAEHHCEKCKVAYCDKHLVPSDGDPSVYRCPECDRYVRSVVSGVVELGRKTPR